MKKIIYRFLISILFIISITIIYLSIIGIETKRFNKQIISIIKNFDENLDVDLKKIKIILDPINLEIKAKTVGTKFEIGKNNIEIESIKTKLSINSFLQDNFSLKDLEISTKSIQIQNLISFARNFNNTPELFLLEKIFKKGYLISDINLEFDDNGKIKDNFKINGFIKDGNVKFSKNYELKKIDLEFYYTQDNLKLEDIKLSLNKNLLLSKNILIRKSNEIFKINGSIENKDISSKDELFKRLLENYFSNLKILNLKFNSKNNFSFEISKKFGIKDFKVKSEIEIDNIVFLNNLELKNFFPNIKKKIELNNHYLSVDFNKNNLLIEGNGNILLQDKIDKLNYRIKKGSNDQLNIEASLEIDQNPVFFNFLGYEKDKDFKSKFILKGIYLPNKKTKINFLSYSENKNNFDVKNLILDEKFKFKSFEKVNFNYLDKDLRENILSITKKKKFYYLKGPKFNANKLIENIIDDKKRNKSLDLNLDLKINIDTVFLDKEYLVQNLSGNLSFKNNQVHNGVLNANFSKNKKFKFTINSESNERVTTIFSGEAEPIIKRYKFIKGYKNGSLDFYSSKKNGISSSNLKLYDFKLKELPILTKILTLASLQGIADILSGEGITFDEFEMNFENSNNLVTINEMYAIGPAISILMDGYVEKNKLVSLRGSLVPATTINKAIGNIPILGKILVGKKTGEGVFGVSFKIKGPPKNLETTVNPIKTLTPRFITRTLEKIKKN